MGNKEILRHRAFVCVPECVSVHGMKESIARVEISFYKPLSHAHSKSAISVCTNTSSRTFPSIFSTLGTQASIFLSPFSGGMLYADRKKAISMKIMFPPNSFFLSLFLPRSLARKICLISLNSTVSLIDI